MLRRGEAMLHQRIRICDDLGGDGEGGFAFARRSIEALASQLTIAPLVLVAAAASLPALGFRSAIARRAALAGCHAKACLSHSKSSARGGNRELRETIPRLTPIEDEELRCWSGSDPEENPYPRWVGHLGDRGPTGVRDYLRQRFPAASLREPHDERR